MKRLRLLIIALLLPVTTFAATMHGVGAGKVAENMMEPVAILANFIGTMSIVIGISCLFAAFLKFMQNRVNPLMSPISTVIVLLIMGIVLLLLPLIYKLTEGGVPINL